VIVAESVDDSLQTSRFSRTSGAAIKMKRKMRRKGRGSFDFQNENEK
jgi:hypothetical protein